VAQALAHELAPVKGAHVALDRATARVLDAADGSIDEGQARHLARELALVLQAALLRRHSTDAMFAAFCATRLETASDVFGLLPAGHDVDALIARASPMEA
jgi:putative acyl-CoA dehydrogenase